MNIVLAWALGGWDMLIILAVVLILFGAKKLPELAKGLGTGIKEFKKATREVTDEIQNAADDKPQQQNKTIANPPSQPVQTPAQTVSQSSSQPKA
jgi:sec-independent protein translocase protein TatA